MTDTDRLNWIAHHSAALRIDPNNEKWYLEVPYHTGVYCIDDYARFDSFREAIDTAATKLAAAIAVQSN